MLELMKDPLFKARWNITIAEERRLALERLRMIITSGLISVTDFRTNPLRIFAAHEIAALSDVSMCADVPLNRIAACSVRHWSDCLH
jgi:acyl-CoA oxidase